MLSAPEDEEAKGTRKARTNSGVELQQIPQGWTEQTTEDGYRFYYNKERNLSLWKLPALEAEKSDASDDPMEAFKDLVKIDLCSVQSVSKEDLIVEQRSYMEGTGWEQRWDGTRGSLYFNPVTQQRVYQMPAERIKKAYFF